MKKFIILLAFLSSAAIAALPLQTTSLKVSGASSFGTSSAPASSAIVDIVSTTQGMYLPRMTTTQKNAIASPQAGLLVFDTTLGAISQYSGSVWQGVGGTVDISSKVDKTGDTMSGVLNMGSHKITNVTDPSGAQDAATKAYVDGIVTSGIDLSAYFKKDGSVTATGAFNMGSHKLTSVTDPTLAQDAATKNYVDTSISSIDYSTFFKKDGSVTATGAFNMGSHKLTSVTDPTLDQDAATKNYVDTNTLLKDGSVSATGNLNLNSHKLVNVTDPSSAQDAATKNYVDSVALSGVDLSGYLKADGTTAVTGNLNLNSHKLTSVTDPTLAQDAATKNYVDTNTLLKDGSVSATGNLNLNSHKLVNVTNPTSAQDAATKNYVDTVTGALGSGDFKADGTVAMTGDIDLNAHSINNVVSIGMYANAMSITESSWGVGNLLFGSATGGSGAGQFSLISGDASGGNNSETLALLTGAVTGGGNSGDLKMVTGTVSGGGTRGEIVLDGKDINVSSKKITNLADPTNAQDAATKNYVGTVISGYFKADGSVSMTGDMNLSDHKINNISEIDIHDAVSTLGIYGDTSNSIDIWFPTSTSIESDGVVNINSQGAVTFGGAGTTIDGGTKKITNLTDPSSAQDAATKAYVDSNSGLPLSGGTMTGNININGNGLTNIGALETYNDKIDILEDNWGNGSLYMGTQNGGAGAGQFNIVSWDADPGNNSENIALLTGASDTATGQLKMITGNGTSGGSTGEIVIQTGTTSGTRGTIDMTASLLDIHNDIDIHSNDILNVGSLGMNSDTMRINENTWGNGQIYLGTAGGGSGAGQFNLITDDGTSGNDSENIALITGSGSSGHNSGELRLVTGGVSGGGTRGKILLDGSYVDADSSQIKNVTDPTSAQDAATKAYVDGTLTSWTPAISGANQGNLVNVWGQYGHGTGPYKSYAYLDFSFQISGGALGAGSVVTVTTPFTIDTSKQPNTTSTTNAGRASYGLCRWFQAGSGWKPLFAQYDDSTHIRFSENPGFLLDVQLVDVGGNNSSVECVDLKIPVSGW